MSDVSYIRGWQMKPGEKRRNGIYGEKKFLRLIRRLRKYDSFPRGEKHWCARLTADIVLKIRKPKEMPRREAKFLAKFYGISAGYVYHLRNRKRWTHI